MNYIDDSHENPYRIICPNFYSHYVQIIIMKSDNEQ